jgi:hypothetical protein
MLKHPPHEHVSQRESLFVLVCNGIILLLYSLPPRDAHLQDVFNTVSGSYSYHLKPTSKFLYD